MRAVGAAGTVAAAAGAHLAAGGALPSPLLLVLLTCALAGLATHAPRRLRGVRMQLGTAAVLQPVLHDLFDRVSGGHVTGGNLTAAATSGPLGGMLLAHAVAALIGFWWLRRGAGRLADATLALLRRCAPVRVAQTPTTAVLRHRTARSAEYAAHRDPVARMRRRGPPPRPCPVTVAV